MAVLAIPTPDHDYPTVYALTLQEKTDTIELFNDKLVGGSIGMLSFQIG
jgi:4,5-DOPA dioxygenase extradiol